MCSVVACCCAASVPTSSAAADTLVLVRPPPCPQHAWPLPAGTSMTETLSREPSESGGGMWDRSGFGSGGEVRQGKGGVALGGCY